MDYASRNAGLAMNSQAQAQTVRESTQLEVHLNALHGLQDELSKTFARAVNLADRLQGQEPPSISNKENSPKNPEAPPLLRQLEIAALQLSDMAQSIAYQINRLERL